MIVSHRYQFIFLKTEKTASSSLARVFKEIAGENDRLYPADRDVRRQLQNANGSLEGFSFIAQSSGIRRILPALAGLHRHARARDVRAFLGPELFARYAVITSERNPFDRQVSLFSHRNSRRNRGRGVGDLSKFSRLMCSPSYNLVHYNRLDNWGIYSIGGEVCADHIIRFEHLHDDLADVLSILGIDPGRFPLPHVKQSRHERSPSYRDLYSDEARRRVASWYRRELDYFGYEF